MSRESRRKIVEENLEILNSGFYLFDNIRKYLRLSFNDRTEVEVFSPNRIEEIISSNARRPMLHDITFIEVNERNSYEAARDVCNQGKSALVLSFANANSPGGGFLKGANAQEEVLCRQSSLYQSISAPDARIMYEVNSTTSDLATDSDYMLVSPHVEVFRKASGEYLEESFTTSVLSLPAPNVRGKASKLTKLQLSAERRNKLRKAFHVAIHLGYDSLILGPWGCGAYGNDVADVATDMHAVLMEEQMLHYFKHIVFAVHDTKPEKPNYTVFADVFRERCVAREKNNTDHEIPVVVNVGVVDTIGGVDNINARGSIDTAGGAGNVNVRSSVDTAGDVGNIGSTGIDATGSRKDNHVSDAFQKSNHHTNTLTKLVSKKPQFSKYPFPVIHWSRPDCTDADVGYARGYFSGNRFFYAQLYRCDSGREISLNLIFSAMDFDFCNDSDKPGDRFVTDIEHMIWKRSVLTKNLAVHAGGYGEKYIRYQEQIMEYLRHEGIVKFLNAEKRDYQMYLTRDDAGEIMVVLSVLLKSGQSLYAKLGYDFTSFKESENRMRIRFIVEMPESGNTPSGEDADIYSLV